MTKEEIVQGLYKGDSRAIKEAIKVLEQRPSNEDVQRVVDYLLKPKSKPTSDDCVSRQAVIDMTGLSKWFESSDDYNSFIEDLCKLPPVTPTQSTCKNCKHWKDSDGVYRRGIEAESKCPINNSRVFDGTFCCANFEKRGNKE